MPTFDMQPIPAPVQSAGTLDTLNRLRAVLVANFRRISDAMILAVDLVGSKDIEITDSSKGIILRSPNGTRYRVKVDDLGVLSTQVV